jgi:hypothetical protein
MARSNLMEIWKSINRSKDQRKRRRAKGGEGRDGHTPRHARSSHSGTAATGEGMVERRSIFFVLIYCSRAKLKIDRSREVRSADRIYFIIARECPL